MDLMQKETERQKTQKIIDLVLEGRSVCIFGRPGTGKTTLIHDIVEKITDRAVVCAAATGRAAMNMPVKYHPTTMNRLCGLLLGDQSFYPEQDDEGPLVENFPYMGKVKRKSIRENLDRINANLAKPKVTIILDEGAVITSEFFYLFFHRVKLRRRQAQLDMTGVNWVICGDFGQLLPPDKNAHLLFEPPVFRIQVKEFESARKPNQKIYRPVSAFSQQPINSELGVHFEVFNLDKVYRQSDPEYVRAIDWVYWGKLIHPLFLNRCFEEVPDNAVTIYYNNTKVLQENCRYVNDYINRYPHKDQIKEYKAIHSNMPEDKNRGEWNDLMPVTETYCLAPGLPFMCTKNVIDPNNPGRLLVANGEKVEVVGTESNSVKVKKSTGETVTLTYVDHLPDREEYVDGKRKPSPRFLMLPGYPGLACTTYKVQGLTFDKGNSRVYTLWQEMRGNCFALNSPGALTVYTSRNRCLEDVYFKTPSGDSYEAVQYLQKCLVADPRVLKFLMGGKEPMWQKVNLNAFIELKNLNCTKTVKLKGTPYTLYEVDFDYFKVEEGKDVPYVLVETVLHIGAVYVDDQPTLLYHSDRQSIKDLSTDLTKAVINLLTIYGNS